VNSGSEKGYRKWFGILKTHHWQTNSALETFMRDNFPGGFTNRWVLINASGKKLGGGWDDLPKWEPHAMTLSRSQINAYTSTLSDKGKKLLYELFASGDEEAISDHCFEVSLHFP